MSDSAARYQALLEHVVCNQCGADDVAVVYPPRYEQARPDQIDESFRSSGDEILVDRLVRCKRCGLMYLDPRLRQDVILNAYSVGEDPNFVSQVEARERTFERSLAYLERFMPARGRVLDIGTAAGSFLAVARRRGWEVAGCEPNRWLCEWGARHYGLPLQPGTVFDMQLPAASFDLVTLWDVLEHTPDPKAVLQEAARVLRPGGWLVVNYPDISSSIARLMGRRWVFLLSVHLYYFTPDSIRRMLDSVGFRTVRMRLHWQSLELGYLFFRMRPYIPWLANFGSRVARALRLERMNIPYWMGQRLVLARREGRDE